jgi:predicted metal-dependent enzyme (double-stranded beta helix superfamily)
MNSVNPILSKIKIPKDDLPYGRYLIHQDKDDRFNIQIHVFSAKYQGSIHCHNTWGIMTVVKGLVSVSDWIENKEGFENIRSSSVKKGTSTCFCPPAQDWHRTDTSNSDVQAVSVHIYGKGWDMDNGVYVNESFEKLVGSRGQLKKGCDLFEYIEKDTSL